MLPVGLSSYIAHNIDKEFHSSLLSLVASETGSGHVLTLSLALQDLHNKVPFYQGNDGFVNVT